MTRGMPPTSCRSVATYCPLGFRSQNTGVRSRIRSKSARVRSRSSAWAMASRCSTAFVLPPTAMITVMAFSKASRVRMAFGRMSRSMRCSRARALSALEVAFSASTALMVLEYGRLMPIASKALLMVFAVYMPPHAPLPGQACRSMPSNSSRVIFPAWKAPTASNTLTMVRSFPP